VMRSLILLASNDAWTPNSFWSSLYRPNSWGTHHLVRRDVTSSSPRSLFLLNLRIWNLGRLGNLHDLLPWMMKIDYLASPRVVGHVALAASATDGFGLVRCYAWRVLVVVDE
jgi:hypothetical protein